MNRPPALPGVTLTPTVKAPDGATIRIIAGEAEGASGPVTGISTSPLYLDVEMGPDAEHLRPLPVEHNAFCYVFEGEGAIGGKVLGAGQLAALTRGTSEAVRFVTTKESMRLLLLAARPLEEPVARQGPFVMNTREEIMKAFEDYRQGTLLD